MATGLKPAIGVGTFEKPWEMVHARAFKSVVTKEAAASGRRLSFVSERCFPFLSSLFFLFIFIFGIVWFDWLVWMDDLSGGWGESAFISGSLTYYFGNPFVRTWWVFWRRFGCKIYHMTSTKAIQFIPYGRVSIFTDPFVYSLIRGV